MVNENPFFEKDLRTYEKMKLEDFTAKNYPLAGGSVRKSLM